MKPLWLQRAILGVLLLQSLITDQANGLPQLLDRARAWVLAEDEPAALKASG